MWSVQVAVKVFVKETGGFRGDPFTKHQDFRCFSGSGDISSAAPSAARSPLQAGPARPTPPGLRAAAPHACPLYPTPESPTSAARRLGRRPARPVRRPPDGPVPVSRPPRPSPDTLWPAVPPTGIVTT